MAKYDNTGDVKRRRFPFFLTIFIIGIVLFIVGVVLIKVTNTKSLGTRYSYNETFDVATIDNMEINFSAGDLNIKKSSDENIHVTGENLPEKINFSSSNSKLQVKTADSLLHLKGGYISFDGSQPTLTIELPEKAFDTVKIDAGAGQMKLSDLTCENLDIDFGAGSSEVINVTCKNEADFDLGLVRVAVLLAAGEQAQSHNQAQNQSNNLLHVWFLHKKLFAKTYLSFLRLPIYHNFSSRQGVSGNCFQTVTFGKNFVTGWRTGEET